MNRTSALTVAGPCRIFTGFPAIDAQNVPLRFQLRQRATEAFTA
jgi:hypothetical protein